MHASMTKLHLLVGISSLYREKITLKFKNLWKISLNIDLTIAKVNGKWIAFILLSQTQCPPKPFTLTYVTIRKKRPSQLPFHANFDCILIIKLEVCVQPEDMRRLYLLCYGVRGFSDLFCNVIGSEALSVSHALFNAVLCYFI